MNSFTEPFFILINRLVCKFEGTQIILDSTGVEYEEFKEKFTGKLHNALFIQMMKIINIKARK